MKSTQRSFFNWDVSTHKSVPRSFSALPLQVPNATGGCLSNPALMNFHVGEWAPASCKEIHCSADHEGGGPSHPAHVRHMAGCVRTASPTARALREKTGANALYGEADLQDMLQTCFPLPSAQGHKLDNHVS